MYVYDGKRVFPDLEEERFFQSIKSLVTSERTDVRGSTSSIQIPNLLEIYSAPLIDTHLNPVCGCLDKAT